MNRRPEIKKYRGLVSAVIVTVAAAIILAFGILALVAGISNSGNSILGISNLITGISAFIVSAFLFIIANIAEDVHYKSYLTYYYGEEAAWYHDESLQKLTEIEKLLRPKNPANNAPSYSVKNVHSYTAGDPQFADQKNYSPQGDDNPQQNRRQIDPKRIR